MSLENLLKAGLIDLQRDMGRWMWSCSGQSYKHNNPLLSECYLIEFRSLFVLFSPPLLLLLMTIVTFTFTVHCCFMWRSPKRFGFTNVTVVVVGRKHKRQRQCPWSIMWTSSIKLRLCGLFLGSTTALASKWVLMFPYSFQTDRLLPCHCTLHCGLCFCLRTNKQVGRTQNIPTYNVVQVESYKCYTFNGL